MPRTVGPYALYDEIARGGAGSIALARRVEPEPGPIVAVKHLHAQYAKEPDFVASFLDEARIARRIDHPNVVRTLDVVRHDGGLYVVMEYVEGASLATLFAAARARRERIPPRIVVAIVRDVLEGLHAAHELRDEHGDPLGVVHRDVSPQNVLVGVDGVARVADFGVAKAADRLQTTRDGAIKGKLAYMPPEQVQGAVTRRTDVYAAGVVAWEALVGARLFDEETTVDLLRAIETTAIEPPSTRVPGLPEAFDAAVMRALDRDPRARFPNAREFARAVVECASPASREEVGAWVRSHAQSSLDARSALVRAILGPPPSAPRPSPRAYGWLAALVAASSLAVFVAGRAHPTVATAPPPIASSSKPLASAEPSAPIAPSTNANASPSIVASASSIPSVLKPIAAPKPVRPGCSPPFEYDDQGKKHYKPGCI